jgi:hypothetical protein
MPIIVMRIQSDGALGRGKMLRTLDFPPPACKEAAHGSFEP